ncbi:MAG: hypothetical protein ACK4FK_08005 [Ferrovibrio sp.]|uniref:hypothetical protein n=1 Tax=Ferrovibrio sp. TaxID=1917215 RepID=UPI0039197515
MADAWLEILKIASGIVGGAIAGHITARRTERDAAIKELLTEIDRVVELSDDYWCRAPGDDGLVRSSTKLSVKLRTVARLNTQIVEAYPTYRFAGNSLIVALRQAATGDHFQVLDRPADPTRHDLVMDAAENLKDAVKSARSNIWQVPIRTGFAHITKSFRQK